MLLPLLYKLLLVLSSAMFLSLHLIVISQLSGGMVIVIKHTTPRCKLGNLAVGIRSYPCARQIARHTQARDFAAYKKVMERLSHGRNDFVW